MAIDHRYRPRILPQPYKDTNPHSGNECCNCKWWVKGGMEFQTGYCHRYAPDPDSGKNQPYVANDQWCGEWELSDQLRLCVERKFGSSTLYFYVKGRERTQPCESKAELEEQEALNQLEWRPLE